MKIEWVYFIKKILFGRGMGVGALGLGDGVLGIVDWAQSPIPNPQSPIPNPHLLLISKIIKFKKFYFK